MPYQLSILGVYVPTVIVLCLIGIAITWIVDRVLSRLKIYSHVWHPALLQTAMLAGVCAMLGLLVYH
ncbi:DUF1656 domain-containing protein [Paraburkholderia sp. LEh10]|uniref:DUF1656 domain-containing protein n=1 Tax=Paraburkholderia sp. LEh10 TaxID=2821353 RepID=UPI001AE2DFD1|nr:DUF1656 domain-containing protein [Paraburkholderia sp. LEh10]MBP0594095.1 DUF1656 domain-containing protein [Paraburkholderia sp. LEh10]